MGNSLLNNSLFKSSVDWRLLSAEQQPDYPNSEALSIVLEKLKTLPPLVNFIEIDLLKNLLARAAKKELFLLQAGDCVERFDESDFKSVHKKIQILLHMASILAKKMDRKVVIVGRIAGQYAKPRSMKMEQIDGQMIPVFRGEMVNGYSHDLESRTPDPKRLLLGYNYSSKTLKHLQNLFSEQNNYSISKTLKLLLRKFKNRQISDPNLIFCSHEGLLLNYESALTRVFQGKTYNTSTHMPWIGYRTQSLNQGHIHYFQTISNPIGIKIGPFFEAEEIVRMGRFLNPNNEPGKICLITRLGINNVERLLPKLIQKVQENSLQVLWCCDPMHGNPCLIEKGIKVREFDQIVKELELTIQILNNYSLHLGGLHCEVSGGLVTECLGGKCSVSLKHLSRNYETYCDPRLNYHQGLELVDFISEQLK